MKTLFAFIKFGSEKNISDLLENGTVYCNTFEYFIKNEDNLLRGDHFEGTRRIINDGKKGSLKLNFSNGKKLALSSMGIKFREYYTKIPGNIYCLTALVKEDIPEGNLNLDSKNEEFGTHFLVINNCGEFIKRLENQIALSGLNFKRSLVKYYDKDLINGEISPFHKRMEFSYQKEYRFIIENPSFEPVKFQLGSLNDIATMFGIEKLKTIKINKE